MSCLETFLGDEASPRDENECYVERSLVEKKVLFLINKYVYLYIYVVCIELL